MPAIWQLLRQPPSGGCVLKPRLKSLIGAENAQPPSGGCVLKQQKLNDMEQRAYAATFGWLCVETTAKLITRLNGLSSHLRVAVC